MNKFEHFEPKINRKGYSPPKNEEILSSLNHPHAVPKPYNFRHRLK